MINGIFSYVNGKEYRDNDQSIETWQLVVHLQIVQINKYHNKRQDNTNPKHTEKLPECFQKVNNLQIFQIN